VQVWPSQLRGMIGRLLFSAAGICLALSPLAYSQALFAGIFSIEARAGTDRSVQIINFQADLPFQYQIQVLDGNTILMRVYNARLAQNLITPEGGVNLLAGGAVQSARLKTPTTQAANGEIVQELVLSGPSLGHQTIQVLGAQQRLVQHRALASSQSSLSRVMIARVPEQGQKKSTGSRRQSLHGFYFSNLQAVAASGGVIQDDNHPGAHAAIMRNRPEVTAPPSRIELEPVARRTPLQIAQGPQITSISGPSGTTPYVHSPDASLDGTQENNSFQPGGWRQSNDTGAESDAAQQMMTAMPRYTGGAKPIQAMTTDNQGHPILIQPKNQPIPEFGIGKASGGYNTLFQAEPNGRQSVNHYMSDALGAYRAKDYTLAQRQVQQALLLDSHNADLLAALAEIQLKLGQTALAQQNYQQAQTLSPEKYGTRYAQMLTLGGHRQEAIQVLETLYRQNPKQVQVAYMLGTLHEELGETRQALSYLQQAAQLHPASADIQYNLGLAYELSGDRLQAEKHYRQALGLNPAARDVTHALARVRQGRV
jgi:Flp pilus assembly protein TadD